MFNRQCLIPLFHVLLLVLVLCSFNIVTCSTTSNWINNKVDRVVDIRGHIESQIITIDSTYQSIGTTNEYYIVIPADKSIHLSLVESYGNNNQKLDVAEINDTTLFDYDLSRSEIYAITLPQWYSQGDSVTFTLHTVYTRTITPHPHTINNGDTQLVLYQDSVVYYSPYSTSKQQTTYKLSSNRIEFYTKRIAGVSGKVSGNDVVYSAVGNIQPFNGQQHQIKLHYENNSAFITFIECVKEVEVSHWGNVAVEEKILMEHTGAQLSNGFNRAQYEQAFGNVPSSWRQLVADLPARAHSLYYTDRIGNISTSNVNYKRNSVHVELQTRYPMFGGWKTDATFGYSLPSRGSIYVDRDDSSRYVLNISFSSAFHQAAVDQLQVRIVLPEGAQNIEFVTPFHIDSAHYDTKQTYLDTSGRPVLVLEKHNVVNKYHSQNIQVTYTYSRLSLLWEPFLLSSIFSALFITAIIYGRIELSIAPVVPMSSDTRHAHKQLQSTRGGHISTNINQVISYVYTVIDSYIDKQPDITTVQLNNAQRLLLELGKHTQLTEICRELYLLLTKLNVTAISYVSATEQQVDQIKQQLQQRITLVEAALRQLAYA